MMSHYVARFISAAHASEYADNAERVNGASNIVRAGRVVEFEAPTFQPDGVPGFYDVVLSVHYYGTNRATVTGEVIVTAGYVCKQCNGPAPVGIGYVDHTAGAAERSADITSCPCGYSAVPS